MPLDKFVLILVVVIGAAALTIWIATLIAASVQVPLGWLVLVPASLVAYIVWRVIADRLGNADDDHYDRIEK
jgi:membrane protein implicated in regulation of membrane protease activity